MESNLWALQTQHSVYAIRSGATAVGGPARAFAKVGLEEAVTGRLQFGSRVFVTLKIIIY